MTTKHKGYAYRTVSRRAGWFAEVLLEGEVVFVTRAPSASEEEATAAARQVIDMILYDGRRSCLD
jgi:hypothetical protein